ncbi:ketopantoate reductase family protein [Hydrogenivirga sp.]
MRFLVVGVGAIGSAYLAFLTRSGHEAVGLVKRGRRLSKLSVKGIWGEFETSVRTVEDLSELGFTPDVVILSVKSYDTEAALNVVEPVIGENTLVMIAQNGYGNYERAVSRFGEGKVILARVIFGSRVIEPGSIEITVSADDVVIGDPAGIVDEDFLRRLAQTFSETGIPTRYEREVYKFLWDKVIYNCALNPLGALLEVNYGTLAENPYTRRLMDRIIEEVFEVTRSAGIETFWNSAEEYRKVFYEKLIPPTSAHFPSMLTDIKRGKTEIDSLNGAICELGERNGVDTPVNRVITQLVKAKELLNRGV